MDGRTLTDPSSFRAHALVHLADLVDGGIEANLDGIQSLGFDGVTIEVTSGPFARLRAITAEPRYIRSDGGFFYPAEPGLYEDTRVKPLAADWLKARKDRSYLPTVADACAARGLVFRLRISAFSPGRLAVKHPDAAGKTVFGDVSPLVLCPADSDVRALVRATVRELVEGYEPQMLEVADLRYWSGVEAAHELIVRDSSLIDDLFEICFSESSRQAAQEAGIDAAAAARRVQVEIEKLLDDHARGDLLLDAFLEDNEPVAEYMAHQAELLDEFARSLVDAYPRQVALVRPTFYAIGIAADEVDAPDVQVSYPGDWDSLGGFLTDVHENFRPGEDNWLEVDVTQWAVADQQTLVRLFKDLIDEAVPRVLVAGWPLIGGAGRNALRQGFRYARRQGKKSRM